MDSTFLQSRIDACKTIIENIEAIILAMSLDESADTKSYTLNTGQSQLTVTKQSLPMLEEMLTKMENRCATLEARLNGAVTRVTPGW